MKNVGTVSIGVRAPIIRTGDDLVSIVTTSVIDAADELKLPFSDNDVVSVTEAVVARAQGNYATSDQIAADIINKTGGGTIGVLFPILSRNRFSLILKSIAKAAAKVVIQLSYPSDEVGNPLLPAELLDDHMVDMSKDSFTLSEFESKFGPAIHPFTKVNYPAYYQDICPGSTILISNDPCYILTEADTVINCDIHTRNRTKKRLQKDPRTKKVLSLDNIMTESVNGSGYNENYGLLGSNLATENSVKLFPRDTQRFVDGLEKSLRDNTGKDIKVMIYGDGAFKDPIGGIWELADPVISPAYSAALEGCPNELKLKYIADTELKGYSGEEASSKMKLMLKNKSSNKDSFISQGTTPRRLTDLLGSLSDLTSGSGDKGTPIILIKGYFDNYSND